MRLVERTPLAAIAIRQGDVAEAAKNLGEILRAEPADVDALNELARLSDLTGDRGRAGELYGRLLAAARNDRFWQAVALNGLGLVREDRNHVEAQQLFERARDLFRELGAWSALGGTLVNLGVLFAKRNDLSGAQICFDEAKDAFSRGEDPIGLASALSGAGAIGLQGGDSSELQRSENYFSEALRLHEQIADVEGILSDLTNLASVAIRQNRFQEAISYLDRAEQLCKRTNNPRGIATVYAHRAECVKANDPDKAVELWNKAIDLFRQIDDKRSLAICSLNLGVLLRDRRQYGAAADVFHIAAEAFHVIGDHVNEARCRSDEQYCRARI